MLLKATSLWGGSSQSRRGPSKSAGPEVLQAEGTILLSVPLPKLPPAQRRNAALYAVEDLVLENVGPDEISVGPEFPIGSGRWLVMVLSSENAQSVSRSKVPVISELMLVDVPAKGWRATLRADKVLLRNQDGSGTIMPRLVFDTWSAAQTTPVEFCELQTVTDMVVKGQPTGSFDLRRSTREDFAYLIERGLIWATFPVLACVFVLWVFDLIHTAQLERDKAEALSQLTEQLKVVGLDSDDPIASASSVLAQAAGRDEGNATFQSLLEEVSSVPFPELNVSVRSMQFAKADGILSLSLGAANLQSLKDVENRFVSSPAQAVLGPTEFTDGMAVAELTLRLRGE